MDTWYKIILNALFSGKKKEETESETTDRDDDMLSNYIELDSLMQVLYHANQETESGN